MNKRNLEFVGLTLFMALCLGVAFLAGYYTHAYSTANPLLRWPLPGLPESKNFPVFEEVQALVETHFNGQLPETKILEHGLIKGYISAIGDPYTVFIEPQTAELEAQQLAGEYGGIGVEISKNEKGEIVFLPFPDSPAEKAGLRAGDVLLSVDGIEIMPDKTTDEVTALVRGLIDTQVQITVRHMDGEELTVTVTRQRIEIPSVTWRMVEGQPTIGLITLSRFSDKTAQEVERAAKELQASGAQSFVVDLRNNGGGLLDSAVEVAGHFLDGGVVMYENNRAGEEKTLTAPATSGLLSTAPVAVLVNGNTASAAEILAGALLDRDRAPLIGQKTFGK
ncbi:MAG: S41 family peptidase, partial [Anaerolineales bacterium]|nr:S41 family peptidase [Anaerolineales bacterium]